MQCPFTIKAWLTGENTRHVYAATRYTLSHGVNTHRAPYIEISFDNGSEQSVIYCSHMDGHYDRIVVENINGVNIDHVRLVHSGEPGEEHATLADRGSVESVRG